ncbi:MAG: ACP phosphodiesterase [Flavobacteriaceae bacterium]
MNYLAHLALAYPNEGLVVGNFIGDHVRNKYLPTFSKEIQEGIAMHRSIDAFTDKHKVTVALRKLLFGTHRHMARVLIDVFYDHFLAARFNTFHQMSLSTFVSKVHPILQKHQEVLPFSAQRYLAGMVSQNWLAKYETQKGIAHILQKMANRSGLTALADGAASLKTHYDVLQEGFNAFYPELLAHCECIKKRVSA